MSFRPQTHGFWMAMFFGFYLIMISISAYLEFEPGMNIGHNFLTFAGTMLKILPVAFILIGLFEIWVPDKTVEKHLGATSGIRGYVWACLLAGLVVGPLYVALPVAHALRQKGARLGVVLTYLGASAVCRVPMAVFEASILGIKFTAIRFIVSLPLVILTSIFIEHFSLPHHETPTLKE